MKDLRKHWPITIMLLGCSLIGTYVAFNDYYTELVVRNSLNGHWYPSWPWPLPLFGVLAAQLGMLILVVVALRHKSSY